MLNLFWKQHYELKTLPLPNLPKLIGINRCPYEEPSWSQAFASIAQHHVGLVIANEGVVYRELATRDVKESPRVFQVCKTLLGRVENRLLVHTHYPIHDPNTVEPR